MAWQVTAVDVALRRAGVDPIPTITPVLCFVDGVWPLIAPPHEFEGVRLEGKRSIKRLVLHRNDLDSTDVERLTRILDSALPPR